MNRRGFIQKTALATAGVFVAPYLLPTGRLFASTGSRIANHVVFCLFAGGIRNQESIGKYDGNLMLNMLSGTESITSDISNAMTILPLLQTSTNTLQTQGTLYNNFMYKSGPTGYYNGNVAAITGTYSPTPLDLKKHPENPTIFEYYRKHANPANSALNSWWVNTAAGPYLSLNYSNDPNYGSGYGANMLQRELLRSYDNQINNIGATFSATEQQLVNNLKGFLNKNFTTQASATSIENKLTDRDRLDNFFSTQMAKNWSEPWIISGIDKTTMNRDMHNVAIAETVIQEFKPELLVVNMTDVDIAHTNFVEYCNNLRKADYALAKLWQTIQSTPGMANDTVLIVAPEHGRNALGNGIFVNGREALDHTGDQSSREIFCMMLGKNIKQNQLIPTGGETIDIVPTIAHILGFYNDIPTQYKTNMGDPLYSAFM